MSSELKLTNIKHPSSGSNNLVLASDGSATATLSSTSVVPASIGGTEVLLNTYTANSSSTIIAITGMSTTYSTYKFILSELKTLEDSITFYWYLKIADGTVRTANYTTSSWQIYYNGSSDGNGQNSYSNTLFGTSSHVGNDDTINGVFYVFGPANTSTMTHGIGIWNYRSHNDYNYNVTGGGQFTGSEAHTAINLQTESGVWVSGTVKMYGIK